MRTTTALEDRDFLDRLPPLDGTVRHDAVAVPCRCGTTVHTARAVAEAHPDDLRCPGCFHADVERVRDDVRRRRADARAAGEPLGRTAINADVFRQTIAVVDDATDEPGIVLRVH